MDLPPMEGLFSCLEGAIHAFLPSPEMMLFTRVTRSSLAILSMSRVYMLQAQRLKPSCQHVPEQRS